MLRFVVLLFPLFFGIGQAVDACLQTEEGCQGEGPCCLDIPQGECCYDKNPVVYESCQVSTGYAEAYGEQNGNKCELVLGRLPLCWSVSNDIPVITGCAWFGTAQSRIEGAGISRNTNDKKGCRNPTVYRKLVGGQQYDLALDSEEYRIFKNISNADTASAYMRKFGKPVQLQN